MKILIIKLGATGDVVRTTPILDVLGGNVTWLTADNNKLMLLGQSKIDRCLGWSESNLLKGFYFDLVVNLEDNEETAEILNIIKYKDLFGAYLTKTGKLKYTNNSSEWFDLSLISQYGKTKADELKLINRKTYQDMIFRGLGYSFDNQKYYLPDGKETGLSGDIAIAPKAGKIWPMKNWAYFDSLKIELEDKGYKVNYLPQRQSLTEHISDIQNHQYLISGDSLPMHIALGSNIKTLSIFICTSPWEIHDYGLQRKIVSPLLDQYFYKRFEEKKATQSISLKKVLGEFEKLV